MKKSSLNRKSSCPGKPLITIITVSYNSVEHLKETLENVISLDYDNIEYIVIDGGSKDSTVDLLNEYSDNIAYWISESDKGIYDAMNKGWMAASNDSVIIYLGSGDKILALPVISDSLLDQITFGDVMIGNNSRFNSKCDFRLTLGNTLHHQALLIPKRIHINPPFSLAYPVYADFDFNQRLFKQEMTFVKDTQFLGYAMPGGISETLAINEMQNIVKKNYGFLHSCISYAYLIFQFLKKR